MRIFSSKYVSSALLVLALIVPFVWAGEATIQVGNAPPVFEDMFGNPILPNDGWSSKANPTRVGFEVTFTATATDPNGDDYYLAICKSDAITPNGKKPPTCDGGAWAVSDFAVKSGQAEILTYEVKEQDVRANEWYAFACDAVKGGACSDAHQGEGEGGSPFYTPRLSTVLRFGDDCPEVAELDELRASSPDADDPLTDPLELLKKPLTRPQVEQMIEDELQAEGENVMSDLKLVREQVKSLKALEKTEKKASKKEKDALADAFIAKRDKLKKMAAKNVRFCVVTDVDGEGLSDVVGKKEKTPVEKAAHRIDKKDLKLNFRNDADRRLEMALLANRPESLLKNAQTGSEGPKIDYKDPDTSNKLITPETTDEGIVARPDIYNTFTLRHETADKSQDIGDVLVGLFGNGDTPAPPNTYKMNVIESIPIVDSVVDPIVDPMGATEEEVIYQSADNRKTDIYKTITQPDSLTPYQIKNYTLYNYGDGSEEEFYTIDDAVLHRRPDGVIEGYYFEGVADLSQLEGAQDADEDLLARASHVMALERMKDLHQNGGEKPDFTISVPFVMDRQNNIIDTLTYEITGDSYNQLRVSFTADTEAYPLVLDPTLRFTAPGSDKTSDVITGEGTYDSFGDAVAVADLNADGLNDLIVGAYEYSGSIGRTYIYFGGADYPTAANSADIIIQGESSADFFGVDVETADLNFDSYTDLIVAATGYNTVYVFYSNGDGTFLTCGTSCSAGDADVHITGDYTLGESLSVGDFDSDGVQDLAISDEDYNSQQGRVYLFYSEATISSKVFQACGDSCTTTSHADVTITGSAVDNQFGVEVAAGDLDNDGDDDLVVGAMEYNTYDGAAYVFYQDGSWPTAAGSADLTITGSTSNEYFGSGVAIGDLDADGDDDLVVGASAYGTSQGRLYVFYQDGTYPTTSGTADESISGWGGSWLGTSDTIVIADMNADGRDDLIGGSYYYNSNRQGRVDIMYNDGSYPTTVGDADVTILGEGTSDEFGVAVTAGDLNNDGTNDLVVGAGYDNSRTGKAYIFYGESGLEKRNTITGDSGIYFGTAVVTGDFNADGKTDLAVSADYYSTQTGRVYIFYNDGSYGNETGEADHTITGQAINNQFGRAMAVGDMDSDGTDDLIIAAPDYNSSVGRIYIFENDGSMPTAAASADDIIDGTGSADLGSSIAVGDLDGDGDDDLAATRGLFLGDSYIHIFYQDGSALPDAGSADHTITETINTRYIGTRMMIEDMDADGDDDLVASTVNGNQVYIFYNDGSYPSSPSTADETFSGAASTFFGSFLVAADVNNDGTLDLITGATGYSSTTGQVYIYYNDGTYGSADDTIVGDATSTCFGDSGAAADLNKDGKTDLIIGADCKDTSTGAAYVFYNDGSAFPDAGSADIRIDGETTNNSFSHRMATGDLNGDGTDDLAIAAEGYSSNTGRVYIFYGDNDYSWNSLYRHPQSLFGNTRTNYRFHMTGGNTAEKFGTSFTTGDFNGDGAKDLAVGAPNYDSGKGRVYIYLNDNGIPEDKDSSEADVVITNTNANEFGYALASGELSESPDTMDDLVIGAPNGSYISFFYGRSSWNSTYTNGNADEYFTYSLNASYRCGHDLLVADLNGGYASSGTRGRDDLAYSCPGVSYGYVFMLWNDGAWPSAGSTSSSAWDDYVYGYGGASGDYTGNSIAAGDFDRDGDIDLVAGAPNYSSDTGRVYIFYDDGGYDTPDIVITGANTGDEFGTSVAAAPLKETRDQWDDILVGGPGYASDTGAVWVIYNDGAYPTTAFTTDGATTGEIMEATSLTGYRCGEAVAVGDVSRNGRKDIAVGCPGYSTNAGRIFLLYNDGSYGNDIASGYQTHYYHPSSNSYGGSALLIDDITGDGFADIISGGYGYSSNLGDLIIHDFSTSRTVGLASNDNFAKSFAMGDFNGDGNTDFAIGAPGVSSDAGAVYVFLKNQSLTDRNEFRTPTTLDADITITGNTSQRFGESMAAGRIGYDNADTIDDLLIGAPTTGLAGTAAVYVFEGGTSGMGNAEACTSTCTYTSNNDELAYSATASYQCGYTVAIGDVDADGVLDTIHSCPGFSTNRGIIFTNTPTDGYTDSYDDYAYCTTGYANECGYGLTVGDMDSDGDDDIVFGAPGYNSEVGAVHILNNDGDYGALDTTIVGETAGDRFGAGVAVGDLDADGDDDIAVGAPGYNTNYGRGYIFYQDGSWPGASSADVSISGNSGYSMGTAMAIGDVSNDGRDDLVYGGYSYYIYFNDGTYGTTVGAADVGIWDGANSDGRGIWIGDINDNGKNDLIVGNWKYSTEKGYLYIHDGKNLQVDLPNADSVTITDTSGYTNDSTPNITISHGGGVPLYAEFSCNGGTNWSDLVPYPSDNIFNDDADESVWNMTTGTTGCSTTNESKTITVRLRGQGGYGTTGSDTTYYDTAGPTSLSLVANNTSTTQISLNPSAIDTGSGLHATPYYYTRAVGASCSRTYNTGYIATDPYTWGSLSANTQYSFDFKARDALTNESGYSACQTLYTSANTPVEDNKYTDDHSTNTTGSIYWHWDSGGSQKNYALDDTLDCSSPLTGAEALTLDYFNDTTPSASNTAYTRYVCARNADNDLTAALTLGPAYTLADTPGAPTLSNETSSSIDVDPVSGGSEKDMAIYVADSDPHCDGFNGYGYVQWGSGGSGGLLSTQSFATDTDWTTDFTVTGLSSGTTYYFCAKARNEDAAHTNDVTPYGSTASTSTTSNPPAYTTLTISDTSGFTNETNPSMTYGGLSGGTPTQHKYSCDNSNWSGYTSYENPTTDFDITSTSYGCNGATNETKTVYVILNNAGGDSSAQSDTTYYDNTGPSWLTDPTLVNDSATELTSTAGSLDDGSGVGNDGDGYDYYYRLYNDPPTCSSTYSIFPWTSSDSHQFSGLSANTEYGTAILPRDGLDNSAGSVYSNCTATYTSANTPTTAGHTSQATTSMRWTWASGGSETDFAYGTTSDCTTGTTSNTYWDESTLSANTAYTRYACARNGDTDKTAALTIGPYYTSANNPGSPSVSNPTSSSLDVSLNTSGNPASTEYAIYSADSSSNCINEVGGSYVQYDSGGSGGLDTSETWATETDWGTFMVTGLSPATTYYFCGKARNGDNDETIIGPSSSDTTSSLTFTEGPSDGSSSTTTPTNEGSDVTFTAKSNPGQDYWLLICDNGNAPTVGNPPECNGGSGNRIARSSSAVTTNTQASATHSTTGETSESYAWYAFVCEAANCSSAAQGTGDSGSPYSVNHAPTFGLVYVNPTGATTYSDADVDPNDTVYFNLNANGVDQGVDDNDSDGAQDTVTVRICPDGTTSYAACSTTKICEHTAFDPSTTAFTCNSATLAAAPYSHGTKNFEVFVQDSHGMDGIGTAGQSFTVTDVDPYISLSGDYSVSNITLTAGDSTAKQYTVTVKDDNGDDDITAVTAALYQTTTHTLSLGMCDGGEDENECYEDSSCALSDQSGSDVSATATCDFTVWFNANDSAGSNPPWKMHANPSDGVAITDQIDSGDIEVDALSGITVTQSSIAYGTLGVGQTSATGLEVSIGNVGNQTADVLLDGTDMAGSIGGTSISISQQKFGHSSSAFDWSTGGHTVVLSASGDGNETSGCLNRDIAVRNDHSSTSTNESIWFKLRIPSPQSPGNYAGSNTILYTPASGTGSCTGTLY